MGSVWLADHLALETQVVVKFMHLALGEDPTSRERFSREAVAASRVKSPHVVQTFDHGVTPEGVPFIVMERLDGEDLAHRVEKGRLSAPELAKILTQVCRALTRAHSVGVVHRDIKPDNIFLCDVGGDEPFVKLLDFGIAKTSLNPKLDNKTRTGAMMGTPYYMSPEQFTGTKDIDFRTDLWSLGIVAYECLTGTRPFDADTIGGLAIAVHSGEIPAPSRVCPTLPPAIDAWFARACARAPTERFQSAKEFADAFAAAALGAPLVAGLQPGPFNQTNPAPIAEGPAAAAVTGPTPEFLLSTGGSAAIETPAESSLAGLPRAGDGKKKLVVAAAAAALGLVAILVTVAGTRHGPAAAAVAPAAMVPSPPATQEVSAPAAPVVLAAPDTTPAAVAPGAPSAAAPAASARPPVSGSFPAGAAVAARPAAPGVSPSPHAAPSHVAAPVPAKPAAANCSPPFTIDSAGVKHPKPECL